MGYKRRRINKTAVIKDKNRSTPRDVLFFTTDGESKIISRINSVIDGTSKESKVIDMILVRLLNNEIKYRPEQHVFD